MALRGLHRHATHYVAAIIDDLSAPVLRARDHTGGIVPVFTGASIRRRFLDDVTEAVAHEGCRHRLGIGVLDEAVLLVIGQAGAATVGRLARYQLVERIEGLSRGVVRRI